MLQMQKEILSVNMQWFQDFCSKIVMKGLQTKHTTIQHYKILFVLTESYT